MSSRVYVGNLSTRVTERELEGFFRPFGRIRDVMLKNGFGFVEFEDPRDAEDAVYEQNGRELCGERVVVELSRRERGFGGGFGGDFGGPPRGRGFGGGGGFHDRGFHGGFHGGGGGYGGRGGGGFRGGDGFRGRGGGGSHERFSARYGPPIQTRYRLLVYNLSTRCSWQDLKDLMRNAGDVTYADAHKRVRNEAIVCFASREDMRRAIDKYQGKDINGRRIKLVDDSEGYSGGEGRGGGGGGGGGSGRGSGGGGRRSRSRSPRSRSRSLRRSRSRTPPSRSASPAAVNGRSPSRSRSRSRTRSPSTEPSRKSGSPRA